jgi:hypothetical protein
MLIPYKEQRYVQQVGPCDRCPDCEFGSVQTVRGEGRINSAPMRSATNGEPLAFFLDQYPSGPVGSHIAGKSTNFHSWFSSMPSTA